MNDELELWITFVSSIPIQADPIQFNRIRSVSIHCEQFEMKCLSFEMWKENSHWPNVSTIQLVIHNSLRFSIAIGFYFLLNQWNKIYVIRSVDERKLSVRWTLCIHFDCYRKFMVCDKMKLNFHIRIVRVLLVLFDLTWHLSIVRLNEWKESILL